MEDCFGQFYDPDVTECKKCTESPHCKKLMAAGRKKAEESAGKKGDKVKKVKKAEKPEREEKVKKHREEDDEEEAPKKASSSGMGDVLKSALARSNYKAVKGKLNMVSSSALYVTIGGKKAAFINKAGTDEPNVRLITSTSPKKLGLELSDWGKTNNVREYVFKGNYKLLGKALAIAFKAIRREQRSESEDED
jgi:hypothetical protein